MFEPARFFGRRSRTTSATLVRSEPTMRGAFFRDAYVLWRREVLGYVRKPVKMLGLLAGPLLWLVLFGVGLRKGLGITVDGLDYIHFILPGVMAMNVLQTAPRASTSLLRDVGSGFMKEVLVAPVDRKSILFGFSLGMVTRSLLQALLLIVAGLFLGLTFKSPLDAAETILLTLAAMLVIGLGLLHLGIAIAWRMNDNLMFNQVAIWFTTPLYFLSGAVYPVAKLPTWLQIPVFLNPLTYAVDLLRHIILAGRATAMPWQLDLSLVLALFVGATLFATRTMDRRAE